MQVGRMQVYFRISYEALFDRPVTKLCDEAVRRSCASEAEGMVGHSK